MVKGFDGPSVRRWLWIVVPVVIALAGCGAASDATIEIGGCANPDLVFDGRTWETRESIPDEWRSRSMVSGSFEVSADGMGGVFEGPDGATMAYTLVTEEFRRLSCHL